MILSAKFIKYYCMFEVLSCLLQEHSNAPKYVWSECHMQKLWRFKILLVNDLESTWEPDANMINNLSKPICTYSARCKDNVIMWLYRSWTMNWHF